MLVLNQKSNRQEVLDQVRDMFGLVPQWLEKMPDEVIGGFWASFRDLCQGAGTARPTHTDRARLIHGQLNAAAPRCRAGCER
jgi:hypothetical protein